MFAAEVVLPWGWGAIKAKTAADVSRILLWVGLGFGVIELLREHQQSRSAPADPAVSG